MGNVRKGMDIDRALRKKGFLCESDGKHIRYFFLLLDGNKSEVCTLMSHGMMGSTIDTNLLSRMARQLRLTKAQFLELIDCTLAAEGYREVLEKQGLAV